MDANSTLLVAVVLCFVIAFVFSMFGQGGGSVYSPLLILLGLPILLSTSTSLVLNLVTSLSAGYIFYRRKMIDFKTSLIFAPGIAIGAFAGGAISRTVDTTALMWMFVVFLLGVGAKMIYSYWEAERVEGEPPASFSPAMYALIALVGLAVGLIAGLLGVGGGILIVPFMVYVCRYPTKWAAGSSHLIISISALAGILGHMTSHSLEARLIFVLGIAVLLGGNLGARTSMRFKAKTIRAGLGLIMWGFAVAILVTRL